jgi:error-prone DNA polymerase
VGLRYVKGFREEDGRRIEAARQQAPFTSIDDFLMRTGLEDGALARLAEAGAFERFEPHRRSVLWAIRGHDRAVTPRLSLEEREPRVEFAPLNDFETIGWDYDSTGHSTRGHPLSPVREELRSLGLPDARTVAGTPGGRRLSYAGIVINRQRPSTAKGVVFMTLEDETGFVNVVIWKNVFQKHMVLAKTASFLGVSGKVQSDSGVVHLVAESLWDPTTRERPRKRRSRDFH